MLIDIEQDGCVTQRIHLFLLVFKWKMFIFCFCLTLQSGFLFVENLDNKGENSNFVTVNITQSAGEDGKQSL